MSTSQLLSPSCSFVGWKGTVWIDLVLEARLEGFSGFGSRFDGRVESRRHVAADATTE